MSMLRRGALLTLTLTATAIQLRPFQAAKPPGALVMVRHGQTTWDRDNIFTGWADPDITEEGAVQVTHARKGGFVTRQKCHSLPLRTSRPLLTS